MWWTKTARAALLLAVSAVVLESCATGQTAPRGAKPQVADAPTPLDQYAIAVDSQPEELALAPHPYGLSQKQRDALGVYAADWREGGSEVITIEAPSGVAGCRCDTRATARAALAALSELGVPPALLRLADYDAGGQADAPVVARYVRSVASTTDCRSHWSNLSSTFDNSASSHFGCAVTQDFAAMIADPRDLQRPSPSQPADGARRAVVLEKYRQGATTSSAKDDQAVGTLSQAVH